MRKAIFTTIDTHLIQYSGQTVEVICELSSDVVDVEEVGRMYRIRFEDGEYTDAFEDELEEL